MANQWLASGGIVAVLGLALGFDLVVRRSPNWLVATALVAAVFLNVMAIAPADYLSGARIVVGKSLLGAVTGLTIMLPFYMLRAMGAGDVKLMAAIGAFLGPVQILGAALLVFLAGGVLSLTVALWSGALKRVAANLRLMCMLALTGRSSGLSLRDVQTTGRLPYALAITAGTGLQIWLATLAGWPFK